MNKTLTILAPISVLVFVVILAVMYGWVGSMDTTGGETPERPERPDLNTAHHLQPAFPAGVGNGQIQLINKPTFPAGVGNGQIQLINQTIPGSPYFGVALVEVPGAVKQALKLPPETGVYVKSISVASPAENAGLKIGDVIIKFDGTTITTHEQVGQIIQARKVGDVVKLVVNRNGTKKSFHVKLESTPQNALNTVAAVQQNFAQTRQNGAAQQNGTAQQNGAAPQNNGAAPDNPFQPPPVTNKIWMGADIQDIDAVMQLQFSLPDTRGVIVSHVTPNSPAMTAGLATGDVIKRFNDARVRDVNQLQSMILKAQPGQQVQLVVLRKGKQLTLALVLGENTGAPGKIPFIGPADIAIEGTWIGMDVGELAGNGAADLGLPAGTRGIVVNDVESPPATMLGFTTGDVIVAINGEPTPDMKHFESATQKQTSAVVDVIRGNRHFFISVPPPGFTQHGTAINQTLDKTLKTVAMNQPVTQPYSQQAGQPYAAGQPQYQQAMQPCPPVQYQTGQLQTPLQSGVQSGQGAAGKRFGIFASTPDLNSTVYGNRHQTPYLIMVDLSNNSFAVIDPANLGNMADTFSKNNLSALVCSDVSSQLATDLSSRGVTIYSGVVGTPDTAIGLYESGALRPARGL
ncbi:MAG: PDZ domain-containing protein [Desulfamplus sp.]|nr:PDZ domain-containing protein [Desulfamplus sp.]